MTSAIVEASNISNGQEHIPFDNIRSIIHDVMKIIFDPASDANLNEIFPVIFPLMSDIQSDVLLCVIVRTDEGDKKKDRIKKLLEEELGKFFDVPLQIIV